MGFNEYQDKARATCLNSSYNLYYLTLGLAGESGEISNKVKKVMRGDTNGRVNVDDLKAELGDVLWYVAVLSEFLGLTLEEVASYNIEKLSKRKIFNKIKGSGDNR